METAILNINLDLSAPSLREIANHYEFLARVCRTRAAELENRARIARLAKAEVSALQNTPAVLDAYLASGMSFETACKAAEVETGIPAETFASYWRKRKQDVDAAAATARARIVLQMTRQGKSDGEIAAYLNIHIKSVSRIRSKMTR